MNYIVIKELNMTTSYIPKKISWLSFLSGRAIFPLTPCYFNEAVVKTKSKRERENPPLVGGRDK